MALMALLFLYLSNKLSVQIPDNLPQLAGFKDKQQGIGHTYRFASAAAEHLIQHKKCGNVAATVSGKNATLWNSKDTTGATFVVFLT